MEKGEAKRFHKKTSLLEMSAEEAKRLHSEGDYNMTVQDIKDIFDASDSWLRDYWLPFVSHIYYPCDHAKLWFSTAAFWEQYEKNATASVQQHPDICSWRTTENVKKKLNHAMVTRAKKPWVKVDLPRDENGQYIVGKSVRRFQERVAVALDGGTERWLIPWATVVEWPRDTTGKCIVGDIDPPHQKDYKERIEAAINKGPTAQSREAVLRWFYLVGAIKIQIFGKVFWVISKKTS